MRERVRVRGNVVLNRKRPFDGACTIKERFPPQPNLLPEEKECD